jgi:hypothetical protein
MTKEKRITEPGPLRGTRVIVLSKPVIVKQADTPVMVILSYEDFVRLKTAVDQQPHQIQ